MHTPELLITANCIVGMIAGGATIVAFAMVLLEAKRIETKRKSHMLDLILPVRRQPRRWFFWRK
jgi:hypothetical protein